MEQAISTSTNNHNNESDFDDSLDLLPDLLSENQSASLSNEYWLVSDLLNENEIKKRAKNMIIKDNTTKGVSDWLYGVWNELNLANRTALVNKLDELQVSPSRFGSINTGTYTRTRKNGNKRESLFNGNMMGTLYSPDDNENEEDLGCINIADRTFDIRQIRTSEGGRKSFGENNLMNNTFSARPQESLDRTFNANGGRKSIGSDNLLNSTFSMRPQDPMESTFILDKELNTTMTMTSTSERKSRVSAYNDNHETGNSDMNDVEMIARRQEETLNRSSRSPSQSPTRRRQISPMRRQMSPLRRQPPPQAQHYQAQTHESEDEFIESSLVKTAKSSLQYLDSPEATFMPTMKSTPFDPRSRNINFSRNSLSPSRDHMRSPDISNHSNYSHQQIMPNVSNLRPNNYTHTQSKIGKSMPNLPRSMQVTNGIHSKLAMAPPIRPSNGNTTVSNHYQSPPQRERQYQMTSMKLPSDSRLVIGSRNGLAQQPHLNNINTNTITRRLAGSSPPPAQRNQMMKVSGDNNNTLLLPTSSSGVSNLTRKSTFRVRNLYASSSEENVVRSNDHDNHDPHTQSNSHLYATTSAEHAFGFKSNSNPSIVNNKDRIPNPLNNHNNIKQFEKHLGNISKIPGPKSSRSAIPVSGTRTAMSSVAHPQHITNATNNLANDWRNGCF